MCQIAADIDALWTALRKNGVHPTARPYLDAMKTLDQITDVYGVDSATSVVLYFLANASSFCGAEAKGLKFELKVILKNYDESPALQEIARQNHLRAYNK